MKYRVEDYARAFYEATGSAHTDAEKDSMVKRFARLIAKNGDARALGKIWTEVRNLFLRNTGGRAVEIECARPVSEYLAVSLARYFSPADRIEFLVDKKLVAGMRITINGNQQIDSSLREKLDRMLPS